MNRSAEITVRIKIEALVVKLIIVVCILHIKDPRVQDSIMNQSNFGITQHSDTSKSDTAKLAKKKLVTVCMLRLRAITKMTSKLPIIPIKNIGIYVAIRIGLIGDVRKGSSVNPYTVPLMLSENKNSKRKERAMLDKVQFQIMYRICPHCSIHLDPRKSCFKGLLESQMTLLPITLCCILLCFHNISPSKSGETGFQYFVQYVVDIKACKGPVTLARLRRRIMKNHEECINLGHSC